MTSTRAVASARTRTSRSVPYTSLKPSRVGGNPCGSVRRTVSRVQPPPVAGYAVRRPVGASVPSARTPSATPARRTGPSGTTSVKKRSRTIRAGLRGQHHGAPGREHGRLSSPGALPRSASRRRLIVSASLPRPSNWRTSRLPSGTAPPDRRVRQRGHHRQIRVAPRGLDEEDVTGVLAPRSSRSRPRTSRGARVGRPRVRRRRAHRRRRERTATGSRR